METTDAGLGRARTFYSMAFDGHVFVLSGEATTVERYSGPDPGKQGWVENGAAAIWYSADALEWHRAVMPQHPAIDRIEALVATGAGFVALGLDFSGHAAVTHALISADGRQWAAAGSFPGIGDQAAQVGGRIVAFDPVDAESSTGWTSADGGQTWQPLPTEPANRLANGLLSLHVEGDYLWAVRSDDPFDDARIATPVELWRTTDGFDWELVGELPESISVNRAVMTSGPAGWVVSTRRITFSDAVHQNNEWFAWHSADGVNWQQSESAPRYVDQIVADEEGFIAIGHDYGPCCAFEESDVRQHVWLSADGSSWRQLSQAGWHGREIDFIVSNGTSVGGPGIDWLLGEGDSGFPGGWGVVWTVDRAKLAP